MYYGVPVRHGSRRCWSSWRPDCPSVICTGRQDVLSSLSTLLVREDQYKCTGEVLFPQGAGDLCDECNMIYRKNSAVYFNKTNNKEVRDSETSLSLTSLLLFNQTSLHLRHLHYYLQSLNSRGTSSRAPNLPQTAK